jgi:CHASE2 domain-containing sensor protein
MKLVESDPAMKRGPLAAAWQALHLDSWRRVAIGLLPLAVALLLAFAQDRGLLGFVDARFFDAVTLDEAGQPPKVVLITADAVYDGSSPELAGELVSAARRLGVERVAFGAAPPGQFAAAGIQVGFVVVALRAEKTPGTAHWRLTEPPPSGAIAGARLRAAAQSGINRRQLTPRQNLPRLRVEQLLAGEIGTEALRGAILLIEPPSALARPTVATARAEASGIMPQSEFSAAAIQTFADGRGVRPLSSLESLLLLVALAAISGLVYLRSDPKRIIPLFLLTGIAFVGAGAWLGLQFANLLLPVTALVLSLPISALLVLLRAELSEDRNLRRFVTQAINLSSHQVLLKDLGKMPEFLGSTARILGVERHLVLEQRGRRLEALFADNASLDDLDGDRSAVLATLRRAARSQQPLDASALVPGWPVPARLASLGPGEGRRFWLYGYTEAAHSAALHTASAIAADFRAIQQLRVDLGVGSDRSVGYRPADEWAGGAVRLVADHASLVASGIDGLETAVIVFHPIGYPLHANITMAALYEALGLGLAETTLPRLLEALTELDGARIATSLNDLMLHGGEIRVNCREIDTRKRQLRVAARREASSDMPRTLSLEVIDVSEPRRLAQLRLSISSLLDVNIRNDLEAIAFALAVARSSKLDAARQDKVLSQIEAAADRATDRLDAISPHLRADIGEGPGESFPVDATMVVKEAVELVEPLAETHGIVLHAELPAISGFAIADPKLLTEMVEAMLRIVIADCAPGEAVKVELGEATERSRITISGGIGMAFERLYAALELSDASSHGPFGSIARGMAAALGWGAVVSYSSQVGKGYRFAIELRRIG